MRTFLYCSLIGRVRVLSYILNKKAYNFLYAFLFVGCVKLRSAFECVIGQLTTIGFSLRGRIQLSVQLATIGFSPVGLAQEYFHFIVASLLKNWLDPIKRLYKQNIFALRAHCFCLRTNS